MSQIASDPLQANRITQAVLDKRGGASRIGEWRPDSLAALFRPEDVAGKRVLDLGANSGGLSLELARMGGHVLAAEPVVDSTIAQQIAIDESLDIEWSDACLFDAHDLGAFDTIVCLGLLYHFRNPQGVLDYLSSLAAPVLYISTQTMPGVELVMRNRASRGGPFWKPLERGVRGYEPTHNLLRRMLEASGFDEIELLTDREYSFPEKPLGLTNSAYYRAACVKPVVDRHELNEGYERYWL